MAHGGTDIFISGGGVNGVAIARDAAGRGLSVRLAEMGDLGGATSSASTKLYHGGLRYLEFFEFSLVRHALQEREILLRAMPHISWPMRFVLPYHADMRFDSTTPTSRLLTTIMPWMKGRRPGWIIRIGLFLYDTLGKRALLPSTSTLDLTTSQEGVPLKPDFRKAFEYSDCWVEDARLVSLSARDAAERGADIMPRVKVVKATRDADGWTVQTENTCTGERQTFTAKAFVNATGPWVGRMIRDGLGFDSRENVRLVRGSHIVTKKLYDHDKCYFFQGTDGRIIFAIPYEGDFTLIGTTDVEHTGNPSDAVATPQEQDYLCAFASQYFKQPVTRDDVVWTFSGVRPLYDDGAASATAATRDYMLSFDETAVPLLNVFGGKITTHRILAEQAVDKLARVFPAIGPAWTADASLPGGDFPVEGFDVLLANTLRNHPYLTRKLARRLVRAYGTDVRVLLEHAGSLDDLGRHFGADLYETEVRWLIDHEFARTAEDIVWRRTKLGLRMHVTEIAALGDWIDQSMAGYAMAAAE